MAEANRPRINGSESALYEAARNLQRSARPENYGATLARAMRAHRAAN